MTRLFVVYGVDKTWTLRGQKRYTVSHVLSVFSIEQEAFFHDRKSCSDNRRRGGKRALEEELK
ncbi:hypothetical protein [Novibacillus thermophilus]|uniref:Uncharacterized protein n=1 Tax=Novibacillus thermophilus TaxID=1471761 RepID=A0A1U9K6V4_9BACL|nr:hypothetical protein [Novibacillus thermophilus]AQS55743.1 hypothetical protein B0W44_08000 [Novibacillus thermophilus]